jgi:hypothetical protein
MARGYSSAKSEYFNRNLPSINKLKAKLEASLPELRQKLNEAIAERDAFWKEYTTVQRRYYGSDGMWPEREYNEGVTADMIKKGAELVNVADRARDGLDKELKRVNEAKKQYEDKADARKRAKEFLPELPNVKRDKEGYLSLDSLESDKEGKKALKKLPQEGLAGIKKQLIKDAASEAFLNGEDNDYFKGKVERTQTMETPSGLVDIKIVADVEYRNDPRGDSNTDINYVKFFVRKA